MSDKVKIIENNPRYFGKSSLVLASFLAACKAGEAVRYEHPDFVAFSRKALREIVICAAIQAKTGEIIRGHRHHDCLRRMDNMHISIRGRVEGFITSLNRFVDRKEAYKLQILAGKESVSEAGYFGEELFSEDLY
jgi:hypothetical protein